MRMHINIHPQGQWTFGKYDKHIAAAFVVIFCVIYIQWNSVAVKWLIFLKKNTIYFIKSHFFFY